MRHLDLEVYLVLIIGLLVIAAIAIVIQVSALSGQGIGATIREIWNTYFGKGNEPPEE